MKKIILVVDDEIEIVKSVGILLREKDREILSANDGLVALEILKTTVVDCIVSDIYMPNMDGIMLIKEIRTINKEVPVIFFTGFGNETLLQKALSYGAYDFIEKPDLDALRSVVSKCLEKRAHSQKSNILSDLDSLLKNDDS